MTDVEEPPYVFTLDQEGALGRADTPRQEVQGFASQFLVSWLV